MAFVVEPVTPETLSDFVRVLSVVYNWTHEFDVADVPVRDWVRDYIARDGERTVGTFRIHDVRVSRGDVALRCGGVGAVAVPVECRHGGVGSSLMTWALRHMRDDGYPLASLYAFSESFYRRFGYEVCGLRWQLDVPVHRMPAGSPELPIQGLAPQEVACLDGCYRQFVQRMSGCFLRTPSMWAHRMGKNPPIVWTVGDPIEAYCWATSNGATWERLKFGEVCWATPRGYRSILAAMRGACINQSGAIWCEPARSPFLAQHYDEGVVAKEDRAIMYRVLDVPRALESLRPTSAGSFRVRVLDRELPENEGPWRVDFEPSGVRVARADASDWECGIGAFTQAFMGSPSLADLAVEGLATVREPSGLAAACALLTPMPVTCYDFF